MASWSHFGSVTCRLFLKVFWSERLVVLLWRLFIGIAMDLPMSLAERCIGSALIEDSLPLELSLSISTPPAFESRAIDSFHSKTQTA